MPGGGELLAPGCLLQQRVLVLAVLPRQVVGKGVHHRPRQVVVHHPEWEVIPQVSFMDMMVYLNFIQ